MEKFKSIYPSILGIWGINGGVLVATSLNETLQKDELILKIILVVVSIIATVLITKQKLNKK